MVVIANEAHKKESLKNRYELMMVISVMMCNPNGDPDAANAPRWNYDTGIGFITDVAIKRWLRNYVRDAFAGQEGMEILMTKGASLNRKIAEAVFSANEISSTDELEMDKKKNKPINKKVAESSQYMCEKYWDCRAFGGVLSTGLNAGQVRGAVQFEMPTSVDPIQVSDLTITRMCYAEDNNCKTLAEYEQEEANHSEEGKRTMGDKHVVQFGMYVLRGTISAAFAERVGFTEADLDVLGEAMIQMLSHNVSSSKAGMRVESPLILFKHVGTQHDTNAEQKAKEAKLGCVPAQKLFNLLSVKKKDGIEYPKSPEDYEVKFMLSKLPRGVEVGFKEMPFEDFTWGDAIRERDYGIEVE